MLQAMISSGRPEVFTEYYRAQERLARDLMRIFALALALPEAWFDGAIDRHFSTCPYRCSFPTGRGTTCVRAPASSSSTSAT